MYNPATNLCFQNSLFFLLYIQLKCLLNQIGLFVQIKTVDWNGTAIEMAEKTPLYLSAKERVTS